MPNTIILFASIGKEERNLSMDPKEGGIEALQKKIQKLLNHKKNCPKLQPKQILSGNFVHKVELENSRI